MNTLKDFIISYVGTYTPSADGIASIDYEFIAASVLLIVLICLFFKGLRFLINELLRW